MGNLQKLPQMCQTSSRFSYPSIQTCKFRAEGMCLFLTIALHSQYHRPLSSKVVYSTLNEHTDRLGDQTPFFLHRGFFQSIRPTVGTLTMNVDVTTGVMFRGGSLIDLCMAILGINNVRELQGQQRRDILRRFLRGLTFKMTRPLKGGKDKVYKISDISGSAEEIRFLNQEGEEITVAVCATDQIDRLMVFLTSNYRPISARLAGH